MNDKKETYSTRVSTFVKMTDGVMRRYVNIVLPEDTEFEPFESVQVEITKYIPSSTDNVVYVPYDDSKSVMGNLRDMEKGEQMLIPITKWDTARTSASTLKKCYGCKFQVNKLGGKGMIGDINVIRVE